MVGVLLDSLFSLPPRFIVIYDLLNPFKSINTHPLNKQFPV